jgi:F-type H+-transporting ATPase subunit alpha
VSRVGGAAQTKIIKKLAGGVKLALAQYRELAAFAQFASDLDAATRAQLERGQRVTELMKQKQYAPLSVAQLAISLYSAEKGFLDDLPIEQILPFEKGLQAHFASNYGDWVKAANDKSDWNDAIEATLKKASTT